MTGIGVEPTAGGLATSPTGSSTTFLHAPSLDGVRGLAVAAVVVYHIWPDALPGGFIGVDVFFVLSGFLLSSLMVREVESTGRFAVGTFFVRRVRRLLPATLLVLLAISLYAATWAETAELDRLREHTIGALTYSINWWFIVDGTTYTDVVVGASPLRHMWSLAIEEQFYIVLAVAVALLARWGPSGADGVAPPDGAFRRRLGIGSLILAGASASWMLLLEAGGADEARLYFGSDTRVQAMLLGAAVGALVGDRFLDAGQTRAHQERIGPALPPLAAAAAAVAGLATLTVFALTASEDARWMFRGGFTLVAVASILLLVGALTARPVGWVLSLPPLVGLGIISYGVYLWHWPVLVILDDDRLPVAGDVLGLVQIAITLALSIASYALIEQPIRRGALGRTMGRASLVIAPAAVVAVGALAVVATATSDEAGTEEIPVAQDAGDPALSNPDLLQIAVVGDSVMHTLIGGDLGTGLEAVPWNQEQSSFDRDEVAITSIARPACSFLPGLIAFESPGGYETADLSPPCRDWRGDLVAAATRPVPVDVTVVMPTNDLEDREIDGEIVAFGTTPWEDLFFNWVLEVIGLAQSGGGDVVLLAPAPRIDPNWSTPQGEREARVAEIFDGVAQANPGVEFIDLAEIVDDDETVRDDGLHYTDEGARSVAAWLTPRLEAIVES